MAKVNLSPYSVAVNRKYSRKFEEDITDLFGKKIVLSDVIEQIIAKYGKIPFREKASQKALKFDGPVQKTETDRFKIIQSVVYYGAYGILTKIMDVNTGVIDPKLIDKEKSPVVDFIFTYVEDKLNTKFAFLIGQTYSVQGYKSTFEKAMQEELTAITRPYGISPIVNIDPLFNKELIELLISGARMYDLTFIATEVDNDSSDILLSGMKKHGLNISATKSFEVAITSYKNKSLLLPRKAREMIEYLRSMLQNPKRSPFFIMTKSEAKEIKARVITPTREFTVGIGSDDFEFREILALDEAQSITTDGAINQGYILGEAKQYAETIAEKYKKLEL